MVRGVRILLVVGIVVAAMASPAAAQAPDTTRFVNGTEDVPLMPDLEEVADSGMIFDTPAGRIVEDFASGDTTAQKVLEFYAATLPQLGWTRDGHTRFRREGEVLELEFPQGGIGGAAADRLVVRFSLSPADAPAAGKHR